MALNDFEFGSDGDLVTAAALNAAEQGTAWTWTQSRTPLGHTRISTSGNDNFTLPATIGGAPIGTGGTRRLEFDLAEAVSDGLTPIYDVLEASPPASITRLVCGGFLKFSATRTSLDVGLDNVVINGTPFLAFQQGITGGAGEGTGGLVRIETQIDGAVTFKSTTIPITVDTVYAYELLWDGTTGDMALILRSSDQSTLVGTSGRISNDAAGLAMSTIYLQSYLVPEGGSNYHDKFWRIWGPSAPFPVFPLTVPTPSNVALVQQIAGELEVQWDSLALQCQIERSSNSGGSWSTLEPAAEAAIYGYSVSGHWRYADATVSDGVTYQYRLTGLIGSSSSASASTADVTVDNASHPVAVDGFNTYTDATYLGQTGTSSEDIWEAISDFVTVNNPNPYTAGNVFGGSSVTRSVAKHRETFNANHRSEATISGVSAGSFQFGVVAVRCQTGASTFYALQHDGSNWYLFDQIAGTAHVITNGTSAVSSGDKIALEANGAGSSTRLRIQKYTSGSWSDIASNIDPGATHYIDGGAPGVGGQGATGSVSLMDDWKGFNI